MELRGHPRPDLLRNESLADILHFTAARRRAHPALLWKGRTVSYAELDAASDAVARALALRGAGPGEIVGLWLPRGADLLIAQAGIAKSGAAWLPLDADAPLDRIAHCLTSAGACGLVTCRDWLERFSSPGVPLWAIEGLSAPLGSGPEQLPRRPVQPDDPAYVIYTSGSTGQPKGIVISQRSICHFLRSENEVLGIHEGDRVYQGFSVAFDMSFEEIWISYLVGATLCIAPHESIGDPDALARMVADHQLTVLHAVPTLLSLVSDPLPSVRLINLGGEACPQALAERWARPGRALFNTYGPTEATVSATCCPLQPGQKVSIGSPLPNYGVLVVDEERRVLRAGEVGELAIFGPGLALEYLNRPELTAEKFVPHPSTGGTDGERVYLTGDLARIDSDGTVHYLGRADGQVKIRGFRVELGEIEAALAAQPNVGAAAVALRTLGQIEQLVGFVVPGYEGTAAQQVEMDALLPAALRRGLAARLPAYMVPAHFELVTHLPRLPSGKVHRRALESVELKSASRRSLPSAAPQDRVEEALYVALDEVLPGQPCWPEADFFDDLGGHSLLAAQLVSLLRAQPRYARLSVQDVYRGRRLDAIAAAMRGSDGGAEPARPAPRARVSTLRRIACGAAQLLTIPLLMVLHISHWLAPFFVYHYYTGDEGDSIPLASLYSLTTFLIVKMLAFGVVIAGKRLLVGRLTAGRYPLWGLTHFRWWLGARLAELPPADMLNGTPLLAWYLRALGARVGRDVLIDSLEVTAPEMLSVDAEASIGDGVLIHAVRVERGELIVGPVHVGREAVIDSYAVLESDTSLGAGARLGGLSALAAGQHIPAGEHWEGSPARRVQRESMALPPRPRASFWLRRAQELFYGAAGLSVAALFFLTVFPSFILIDWIDSHWWNVFENGAHPLYAFGMFFLLGIPASMALVLATVLLAAGLKWLLLGRQQPGIASIYSPAYLRKWLLGRVLDSSLIILHGLYASVFAAAWFRLMGASIGRDAEISTATSIVPDLLRLGDDSFIADGVLLGDEEQRGGWFLLAPTTIGNRSFVGNGAYVPDGATVPDDVLIGVHTRTPDDDVLAAGQTWMGSPALLLPAREPPAGYPAELTFRPTPLRRLGRGTVEALRIVLPMALIISAGYLIIHQVMPLAEEQRWWAVIGALALAGCIYGLGSLLLVVLVKWLLVSRYRPSAAPMWTPFVWLSEAVTNLYESLAVPNLLNFLRATPLLPLALRLLGARIGRRTFLDTTDLTEFDCVHIGDDSELNARCGPQTHLFEDRVMKIGRVQIGARVTVGPGSTILYNTLIGDDVQLGPLTLVAKGERLPAGTCWEGSPAGPVELGRIRQ